MKHTVWFILIIITGLFFSLSPAVYADDSNEGYFIPQQSSEVSPLADPAEIDPSGAITSVTENGPAETTDKGLPQETAAAASDPVSAEKELAETAKPIIQDYLDQVKVEDTLSSMASLRAVLTKTDEQISSVIHAMNQLSEQNEIAGLMGNPLTKQFKKFIREIEKTATYINAVIDATGIMQESGTAYFSTWEKSLEGFNNASIRNRSRRRLTLTQRDFDQISKDVDRLKSKLEPFLAQLEDMRNFLNYDLNAEAISSISDLFARTNTESGRIQDQIALVMEKLDALSTMMSPKK